MVCKAVWGLLIVRVSRAYFVVNNTRGHCFNHVCYRPWPRPGASLSPALPHYLSLSSRQHSASVPQPGGATTRNRSAITRIISGTDEPRIPLQHLLLYLQMHFHPGSFFKHLAWPLSPCHITQGHPPLHIYRFSPIYSSSACFFFLVMLRFNIPFTYFSVDLDCKGQKKSASIHYLDHGPSR